MISEVDDGMHAYKDWALVYTIFKKGFPTLQLSSAKVADKPATWCKDHNNYCANVNQNQTTGQSNKTVPPVSTNSQSDLQFKINA